MCKLELNTLYIRVVNKDEDHGGPRDQDLCDHSADMLWGPQDSFCKQMGIY